MGYMTECSCRHSQICSVYAECARFTYRDAREGAGHHIVAKAEIRW